MFSLDCKTCSQFGLQPILAFDTAQNWQGALQLQLLAVLSGSQQVVTVKDAIAAKALFSDS